MKISKSSWLLITTLGFASLIATDAHAFPSWMGVYGDVQRQAGGNPGTFTILMNQDYWGLHAAVGFQINGGAWTEVQMSYAGNSSGNSKWTYTPANGFPAGATVKFYFHGWDEWGGNIWDSNGGQNYSLTVPGSTIAAPVFWELDPYRGDREKVRVNGRTKDAALWFGAIDAGLPITVSARPVENGNGNLVQLSQVTTRSYCVYTTKQGDWSNAQVAQGVFRSGGISNKPIFDYFTYDLGTFPAGTRVWFWLGAENTKGAGYAQSAGQDYSFTIAGNPTDTDNDGLPDPWEQQHFSNLTQGPLDNPDGEAWWGWSKIAINNVAEYVNGTDPKLANDGTGFRFLWYAGDNVGGFLAPNTLTKHQQVTLSYHGGREGQPLFNKTTIFAHVGKNGWKDTSDTAALTFNGALGRYEVTITVPGDATVLDVCFTDKAGNWDNNAGKDWHIPVK